ncbi:MAG: von Willebrand factor type A domain-containing protein [Verrucomicrobiae bacterium]|nr:von Willebrand factor type A domain-containing protein [Verrucomicrobiae bacterium]
MNDGTDNDQSQEPLHTWIEPELEARLTALVLGEASDFEREELEREIAARPELGAYRKRLEAMHLLLSQVGKGESEEKKDEWKLSGERRSRLLAHLGGEDLREVVETADSRPEPGETPVSRLRSTMRWWKVAAASLAAAALLSALLIPASRSVMKKAKRSGPVLAAEVRDLEEQNALNYSRFSIDAGETTTFSSSTSPSATTAFENARDEYRVERAKELDVTQLATVTKPVNGPFVSKPAEGNANALGLNKNGNGPAVLSSLDVDDRDFLAAETGNVSVLGESLSVSDGAEISAGGGKGGTVLMGEPTAQASVGALNGQVAVTAGRQILLEQAGEAKMAIPHPQAPAAESKPVDLAERESFAQVGDVGVGNPGSVYGDLAVNAGHVLDASGKNGGRLRVGGGFRGKDPSIMEEERLGEEPSALFFQAGRGGNQPENDRPDSNRQTIHAEAISNAGSLQASSGGGGGGAVFVDAGVTGEASIGGTVRTRSGSSQEESLVRREPSPSSEPESEPDDKVPNFVNVNVLGKAFETNFEVVQSRGESSESELDSIERPQLAGTTNHFSYSGSTTAGVMDSVEQSIVGDVSGKDLRRQPSVEQRGYSSPRGSQVGFDDGPQTSPSGETPVDRSLKTAEDYAEIGDLDKAQAEDSKVLNADKYNSAARRGLEAEDQQRMDFYETARNETRSEFIRKVAEDWELPVTPQDNALDEFDLKEKRETKKSNPNAHAGGATWGTPMAGGDVDRDLSKFQPSQHEWQEYPGHPASTPLPPVKQELDAIQWTSEQASFGAYAGDNVIVGDHARTSGAGNVNLISGWADENREATQGLSSKVPRVVGGGSVESEDMPAKVRLGVRAGTSRNSTIEVTDPESRVPGKEDRNGLQDILALTPQIEVGGQAGALPDSPQEEGNLVYWQDGHGGGKVFGSGGTVDASGLETLAKRESEGGSEMAPTGGQHGHGQVTPITIGLRSGAVALDGDSIDALITEAKTEGLRHDVMSSIAGVPFDSQSGYMAIDLNLTPEAVEFDGFVNFGAPITTESLGKKLRFTLPAGLDETATTDEAFSTFSLHVSDVSFQLAMASLAEGEWPDRERIRIEEFVNAFDYGDPMPGQSDKVACRVEQAAHPFFQQRNLLRISMRTAEAGRSASTPLRLTFLLDNSGSMERTDRQETVKRAFATLAAQLQPNDQVSLISFARQPRLVADAVSGAEAGELVETVSTLPAEGGTNLEAALQLAFEKAKEHQLDGAQNRIVLLTDGAANLGDAEPENLARMIESMRESGIAFDAAGIGADGLNDEILEALTRKGDGRYYLLDRPEDAEDGFAKQIAGALRPAAKNVKVQVEFNPDRVGRYKLLGFEKHRLEKEDFRNDAVDAAEMAAAEAGVAVYQVEPLPEGEGDLGSVSVRFRDLDSGEMVEKRWPIPFLPGAPSPDQAADSMRLATVAAQFAAKLKGGPLGDAIDLGELARLAASLPERDQRTERVRQLREMIEQARQLEGNG